MRKIILIALSLVLLTLVLLGCKSKENITNEQTVNHSKKLSIDSNFTSITISKSISFDDDESLSVFQNVFSSAVKEEGIVNMADPEYYLEVIYDKENRISLYLWIGDEGQRSTLMKTEDTHTIYTVSEEMTVKLIELVESHFN
ncbi:hypothetical protein ACFSFW_19375 [Fredinandcohnia salidurans]|uniref:YhfM-like domain-containing protein n=1 Tax=Fredinandcohnia salidurans TaxID=2595041 RepID=A0ABW4MTA0_9BACI